LVPPLTGRRVLACLNAGRDEALLSLGRAGYNRLLYQVREEILTIIGGAGVFLLAAVVLRVLRNGLARQFPWFTGYTGFVLVSSTVGIWLYRFEPGFYNAFYWFSEISSLLLGIAVSFEIVRSVFAFYSGIRRLATVVLQALLLPAAIRAVVVYNGSVTRLWLALERDVRLVQALILIAICLLSVYYSIELNRNQKGILGGYSLFISFSVINLAFRLQTGAWFHQIWDFLQPGQYIVCEAIWCVSLWRRAPQIAREYDAKDAGNPAGALDLRLRRLRRETSLGEIT
jgi:hypothetical protein